MNNLIKIINKINGTVKVKTYWCDYIDKQGNCFNNQFMALNAIADDEQVISAVACELAKQGYTVYSIFELQEGFTKEDVIKQLDKCVNDYEKYVRPLYINFNILKSIVV